MHDILKILNFVLSWIIVPIIMFSLLIFGLIISGKLEDEKRRTSAYAGFWAGLVLFVFIFIYQTSSITIPRITLGTTMTLSIPGGLMGTVTGFVTLWVLKPLIKRRAVGILTLFLSFCGAASLFSYFFIRNMNQFLLSGILGIAFGTLVHFVIFPENAHDLFSK